MRCIAFLLVILASATAFAHKPSDAHLVLEAHGDRLSGRIDVAVRDLDAAVGIDDGDGAITWAELKTAAPRIASYLDERLTIDGCTLSQGAPALVDLSDGADCSTPSCSPSPSTLEGIYLSKWLQRGIDE